MAPSPTPPSIPDVQLTLGTLPPISSEHHEEVLRYASPLLTASGQPSLSIWTIEPEAFLRMNYADGTEFWIDHKAGRVWAQWPEKSSLENVLSYLVGPVMGVLLRLRKVVCLHASVAAISKHAVVFVGPEGAGKSTTAAAFAKIGCAILADDIAALREEQGKFLVLPAYPRVNLWPEAVKMLYGSPNALPPIIPDWEKRALPLGREKEARFEAQPLPVGAIYILGDPETAADATIEPISRKNAMMALVANTYATNFLDTGQRAQEFDVLGRLVGSVTVRKINPRRKSLPVEELCQAIREDFDDTLRHSRSF